MAKQIKIFGGNWTRELEKEVNDFIKDKNVVDIRYKFEKAGGVMMYHNVLVIYEVE